MKNLILFAAVSGMLCAQDLGIFTHSGDVGSPALDGKTTFADGVYRITGAGANIWAKQDQFHYVWREITGNFTVTAHLRFLGTGADHRKAGIMVRQSLDTDAANVHVAFHGNGMPALQWRSRKGEDTNAFDLPLVSPGNVGLKFVRTGVKMYMYMSQEGAPLREIAHTEVSFQGPVLVGLAVCSHDAKASDTVLFSGVTIE